MKISFKLIRNFVISFTIFLAIDMLWLGIIAVDFYRNQIGFLMRSPINWFAAIIFYLIFIIGLLYFVIHPAILSNNWKKALYNGLFLGFLTYCTYDLTNLATLKDWPIMLTLVDIAWGTFLGGFTSIASYFVIRKLE